MCSEKSCGAIVINQNNKTILVIQQKQGFWSLPKGHIKANESEIECAIREVKEETNIDITIINSEKYLTEYTFFKNNELIKKTVIYFLAYAINTNIKIQNDELLNAK
ncbi:UNVERIFIED_CONTAM: NUDIX domain-containing protein [Campylobacter lari]